MYIVLQVCNTMFYDRKQKGSVGIKKNVDQREPTICGCAKKDAVSL